MCQLCKKLDKRQISFNGRLGSTTKLSSSANLKVLLFPQISPQISALWGSLNDGLASIHGEDPQRQAFSDKWQWCFRITREITENISKEYNVQPAKLSNQRKGSHPILPMILTANRGKTCRNVAKFDNKPILCEKRQIKISSSQLSGFGTVSRTLELCGPPEGGTSAVTLKL